MTEIASMDVARRQWALALLDDMIRGNAYGQLYVTLENGRVVHAKQCYNRKPED